MTSDVDMVPPVEPADAAQSTRYVYPIPVFIGQVGIGLGIIGVYLWGLIANDAVVSPYALGVIGVGWVLWRGIREVYRNPHELRVTGDQLTLTTFSGRQSTWQVPRLRCSERKNATFGSYDIYDKAGSFAFRLYVWVSHYDVLRDLIREKGGSMSAAE